MGWKSVVRELVKALSPTVVLPALVAGLIIYCFGFTLESLVAVLVFTQLYIAWAEVEVALRQAYLAGLEYEPVFDIELVNGYNTICMVLINKGKSTARNIFISTSIKPLQGPSNETSKSLTRLDPDGFEELGCLSNEAFNISEIIVELKYETVHGKSYRMLFTKNLTS